MMPATTTDVTPLGDVPSETTLGCTERVQPLDVSVVRAYNARRERVAALPQRVLAFVEESFR